MSKTEKWRKWRLALDMGTNSIGWAALSLDDSGKVNGFLDTGVRIFSDGREPSSNGRVGESLAVERRLARGARRNRDRRLKRKNQLLKRLIQLGLMPRDKAERKALEKLDPYRLRAAAIDRPLSPSELGRVLFHINQRRGFKSNRKSDNEDEESGVIKPKISALRERLGTQTLGQWLYKRIQQGESTRFRGNDGDLYADRAMYLEEFERIKEKQKPHHKLLDADWDDLKNGDKNQGLDGIFFQRELKPVERGRCEFFIEEPRAHKDLPIAHEFRILSEVANLQYYTDDGKKHPLDLAQRTAVIQLLETQETLAFSKIRKLKVDGKPIFPKEAVFNLEEGPRDKLNGNKTAAKMCKPEMLGKGWSQLSSDTQNDLIELLHDAVDKTQLVDKLISDFALEEEQANAVASGFKLSPATTSLSRKFMSRCTAIMKEQQIGYAEATGQVHDDDGVLCQHSNREGDGSLDALPYYGELLKGSVISANPAADPVQKWEQHFGKINNPTVHVALNQLRKLLNCLIEQYGKPAEIHVELTRELKKTKKVRDDITKQNKAFAKDNERRATLYRDLHNDEPSGQDIKKIKLWEELGADQFHRPCPFSGTKISAAMLFNGVVEIEHILPFSRTLDNSTANLTLSMRYANQLKGNRTPFEAFNGDHYTKDGIMAWRDISYGAKRFPKNKRWRFDEDAMEQFERDNDFIARQLTDTAYISRITKRYLSHICDKEKIVTIPGGLTAMMRGKWHLNSLLGDHNYKERIDHRHHAIDAFVVGLTDRGMLKRVSDQTKRSTDGHIHIKLPDIAALKDAFTERLDKITISYKADHGGNRKMFKETAYGIVPEDKQDTDLKGYNLVTRKKLNALNRKETGAIRNHGWRNLIEAHLDNLEKAAGRKLNEKKELPKALADFGAKHNIKTIRILVSNQSAIKIESAPFKAYAPDSYACVDIWQLPKGKKGKWQKDKFEWKGAFWSYAQCLGEGNGSVPDKNRGQIDNAPIHPAAKFITRLFKDDLIEVREGEGEDAEAKIMRVVGFSTTNNRIDLRPQYETQGEQQYRSINVLQSIFMKKLNIMPDGRHRG